MKIKIILWLQIFFILFSCSFVCAQEKPNIILLIVDTLRPDRLGCYGYKGQTSPNIDALSEDSLLFSQAVTPVPLTAPSHASIFSGLYPHNHGLLNNGEKMETETKVLAEILKENGYKTGGFVSVVLLDKKAKMDRGFDKYEFPKSEGRFNPWGSADIRRNTIVAKDTVDEALSWLKKNKKDPFFLWVHLYDPHWPYSPPDEYINEENLDADKINELNMMIRQTYRIIQGRSKTQLATLDLTPEGEKLIHALYDGEIKYSDDQLGRLFSYLKENKLYNDSIIIFMSDHGEMQGEKPGFYGHAPHIWEGALRIPLMMKLPGIASRKTNDMARTIDVMPTLLSYLDIKDNEKRDGVDLLSVAVESSYIGTGLRAPPSTTCSTEKKRREKNPSQKIGLRTSSWKYWTVGNTEFLFDISKDLLEKNNLAEKNVKKAKELSTRLDPYKEALAEANKKSAENFRTQQGRRRRQQRPQVDRQRQMQLKSLGYL